LEKHGNVGNIEGAQQGQVPTSSLLTGMPKNWSSRPHGGKVRGRGSGKDTGRGKVLKLREPSPQDGRRPSSAVDHVNVDEGEPDFLSAVY
jgi:hypothetical protein